jgi:hypothetical protein
MRNSMLWFSAAAFSILSASGDGAWAGEREEWRRSDQWTIKEGDVARINLESSPRGYVIGGYIPIDIAEHVAGVLSMSFDAKSERVVDQFAISESRKYYRPNSTMVVRVSSIGIRFPRKYLRKGDLIPLTGAVCRITELRGDESKGLLSAEVVPKSELPPGVSYPREKHAVPVGGYAGVWDGSEIAVDRIAAASSGEGAVSGRIELAAMITVKHDVRTGPRMRKSNELPPRPYKVGDVIDVPIIEPTINGETSLSYIVRGIVPRDEKRRVVGWILIEPAPGSPTGAPK